MKQFTIFKLYLGVLVYEGDKLVYQTANVHENPTQLLRSMGNEVRFVAADDREFMEFHNWNLHSMPRSLDEMLADYNRWRQEQIERRLAGARATVGELEREQQRFKEVTGGKGS
jgi:hypothetical protein